MKDYKHTTTNLRMLKRELKRAFEDLTEQKKKAKRSKLYRLSITTMGITLLVSMVIFITTRLFGKESHRGKANYGCSYLGDMTIRDEFENMENSLARGGNDVGQYQKENPELRFFFYKVKQGESVSTIAQKLNINMDTIISLNGMEDAHTISVGKRILVPTLKGILYTVQKGDTMEKIAKENNINIDDITDANDLTSTELQEGMVIFLPGAVLSATQRAKALGYLFSKPLHGRFTSGYGIRRHPIYGKLLFHTGIDVAAPYGSSIRAAKDGKVIFAGWKGGYGKCVIIKHQFGYETLYGHMSRISVKTGSYVQCGQTVGRVGSTGVSTGPHLHFEVKKYGRPTNPLQYSGLKKSGGRYY